MTQREIAPILGVTHPTVGKLAADWRKSQAPKSRANGSSKVNGKVKRKKTAKRKKVRKS